MSVCASLILLGCVRHIELDCSTLGSHSPASFSLIFSNPAEVDLLRFQLTDACATLDTLRNSIEKISRTPDSATSLPALLRGQLRLDEMLHQMLANTASSIFQERSSQVSDELTAIISTPVAELNTSPSTEGTIVLEHHRTDFEAARIEFISRMESLETSSVTNVAKTKLSLFDSLHTLLNPSFRGAILSNHPRNSPELDSIRSTLAHLVTRQSVQTESNATFLDDLETTRLPLRSAERNVQTQELVWRIYQSVELMVAAVMTLERLSSFASDQVDLRTGVRLDDSILRLHHVASKLERNASFLRETQDVLPKPVPDSLHQAAITLQDDLIRGHRSIENLQSILSSQDEIVLEYPSLDLLSNTASLVENIHQDLDALNDALLSQFRSGLQNYGGKIFLAILLALVALGGIRIAIWLLNTISERSAERRLFYKRLIPIIRLAVLTLTTYIVLAFIFKVDQRSLIAAGAAIGVAVGFASQNILKNIFGGMIIIFDQPFQAGDKIRVGETYGEVVSIGLRTTRIMTPNDNLVSVPNAHVMDTQVANANSGALHCQVVVELYIPGWCDTTKAKGIAYHAAANSKYVYLEKPIVVNVRDVFKETFLTQLSVKAYVLDTRHEFAFASDVTETAKSEFRKQGYLSQLPAHTHQIQAP